MLRTLSLWSKQMHLTWWKINGKIFQLDGLAKENYMKAQRKEAYVPISFAKTFGKKQNLKVEHAKACT